MGHTLAATGRIAFTTHEPIGVVVAVLIIGPGIALLWQALLR